MRPSTHTWKVADRSSRPRQLRTVAWDDGGILGHGGSLVQGRRRTNSIHYSPAAASSLHDLGSQTGVASSTGG